MLVAAAVCPHPPLIVPELAGSAAPELDDLRTACVSAIRSLAESEPDLLVVVGGAEKTASYPGDASGTMKPWGPDVRVGTGEPSLPLSLTIGRWLLELSGVAEHGPIEGSRTARGGVNRGRVFGDRALTVPALRFEAVAADASPAECLALGRGISRSVDRVAVLALGDGSARLTEKSPGYLHPLAMPYNEMLAEAIANAAADRLSDMDPAEAEELWVAGRAAFQVLAGAAEYGHAAGRGAQDVAGKRAGPRAMRRFSELLYNDSPYGVGYFVARWVFEEVSPS